MAMSNTEPNSWTKAMARRAVGETVDRPDVDGVAQYPDVIRVFGPGSPIYKRFEDLPPGWTKLYRKTESGDRTQRALAMLAADPGLTRYAAARAVGINPSCLTRALQRKR